MDPQSCFIAWLNASHEDRHEFYTDLCDWFARGGFGIAVRVTTARGTYARAKLIRLTHTGDAYVTYRNHRTAIVRADTLGDLGGR